MRRFLLPFALLVLAAGLCVTEAVAGKAPVVSLVVEGRSTDDHRPVVRVLGKGLNKVISVALLDTEGEEAGLGEVVAAKSKFLVARLPQGLEPGEYDLVLKDKKGNVVTSEVSLRLGGVLPGSIRRDAVEPGLLANLGNVSTVQGNDISFFVDAGNLTTGTLSTDRFGALADLSDEAFVVGGELVPATLSAHDDLKDEGVLDGEGNLETNLFSAWDDLVAENAVSAQDVWSTDHLSARDDLLAEGHLDVAGRLDTDAYSAWADLVDEGYVDGDDLLETDYFSAWDSLESDDRIGDGASQLAAGDHDHDGEYLSKGGGSVTGSVDITETGFNAALYADIHTDDVDCLRAEFTGGSAGGWGMHVRSSQPQASAWTALAGRTYGANGIGVLGVSDSSGGTGISVTATKEGARTCRAGSTTGYIIHAVNEGGGVAFHLESRKSGTAPLEVAHRDTSVANEPLSSLFIGKDDSGNVARIDMDGKGYFNGGTATSGADFAEAVRVDTKASDFEAGDVVIIDRASVRGFAMSTTANSRLVAGVVSTKPGILAMPRQAATPDPDAEAREIPLAIAGIVPVKICDENGPVRAGDELVSASLPGYAMKAPKDAAIGTVIGKALGAHARGKGTVEVLLTLR